MRSCRPAGSVPVGAGTTVPGQRTDHRVWPRWRCGRPTSRTVAGPARPPAVV